MNLIVRAVTWEEGGRERENTGGRERGEEKGDGELCEHFVARELQSSEELLYIFIEFANSSEFNTIVSLSWYRFSFLWEKVG